MEEVEDVVWAFFGYETAAKGQPVQEWFDRLLPEERDEVLDTLSYLQTLPLRLWGTPEYEPLGDGLSEVRIKVNVLKKFYRIYGFFWPCGENRPRRKNGHYPSYTFLLGKEKKVKNDKRGTKEARSNMRKVEAGEAKVHAFKFS